VSFSNILNVPDFQRNYAVVLLIRQKHMASSHCTYLRMTVLHREKGNFCVSFHGKTLPTGQPNRQCITPLHSIIPQVFNMSMSDQ